MSGGQNPIENILDKNLSKTVQNFTSSTFYALLKNRLTVHFLISSVYECLCVDMKHFEYNQHWNYIWNTEIEYQNVKYNLDINKNNVYAIFAWPLFGIENVPKSKSSYHN